MPVMLARVPKLRVLARPGCESRLGVRADGQPGQIAV